MPTLKRLIATAVAGSLIVLASPNSAVASTKSISDPRGDAPAALDIVRVQVDNGSKVTVMTASMRDLGERGLVMFGASIREAGPTAVFFVRKTKSRVRASVIVRGLEDEYLSKRSCPGARAEWTTRTNNVKLTIPKPCLAVNEFEFPRDDFFVDTLPGLKPTFAAVLDGVDRSETVRVPRS